MRAKMSTIQIQLKVLPHCMRNLCALVLSHCMRNLYALALPHCVCSSLATLYKEPLCSSLATLYEEHLCSSVREWGWGGGGKAEGGELDEEAGVRHSYLTKPDPLCRRNRERLSQHGAGVLTESQDDESRRT